MTDQMCADQKRTDRINPLGVIRDPLGPDQESIETGLMAFDSKSIEQRRKAMELDLASNPMAQAQEIITQCSLSPDCIDGASLRELLSAKASRLIKGKDTSDLQELLLAQTLALNAVCQTMIQKANYAHLPRPDHEKLYLDLALRFQKQSLRTMELIATLQTPKATTLIQQHMQADNIQVNHTTNELLGS